MLSFWVRLQHKKLKTFTALHMLLWITIALFSALPVTFKREVENLEVKEGESAAFCCELSKPGAPFDWRKGRVILKAGYKYEMKQERGLTKLIINNVEESDAGKYTCKTEDSQSTAELTVKG